MPNQINYPDPIPVPYIKYRPERLSEEDRNLVQDGIRQVLFGSSAKDYAELWIYDSNGGISGHINLNVTHASMSLSTDITNTGAYELLNLDMGDAVRLMVVESGRYGFTANFFRDEVGSEYLDNTNPDLGDGRRLYISNISDDRTELLLTPKKLIDVSDPLLTEIYEWALPSVPRLYAQGLVDQTFGRSLPAEGEQEVPRSQQLTSDKIMLGLDDIMNISPPVHERVLNADAQLTYDTMMAEMIPLIGLKTIELMQSAQVDKLDPNIQEEELYEFIRLATVDVVNKFKSMDLIDPRFNVYT